MERIGIFGGSFNPIHKGHIRVIESALKSLQLDRILVIPSGMAPHKSSLEYAPAEHRLEMCRLATEHLPVEISDFEIRKQGKSYTVETLRAFEKIYPDAKFFLIVGGDMFLSFDTWYCYEEILSRCVLCGHARKKKELEIMEQKAKEYEKKGEILLFHTEPFEVSSTEIRKKIKNNENITCFLTENVVQYIIEKNLYREEF